jgi:co-chaperonin GroES (HSP10)
MSITAIKNHIVFQFVDPVNSKGEFEEAVSEGGLYIKGGFDKSAKSPRWAIAMSVGKECEYVQAGDKFLVPALRWTEGVKHEDQFFWKTDETQVVGVYRDGNFKPINKHVLFVPKKEAVTTRSSGLMVISHQGDDSAHGKVVFMDTEVETPLMGTTIYYDSSNFFDEFVVDGIELSFIKEDNIWLYVSPED